MTGKNDASGRRIPADRFETAVAEAIIGRLQDNNFAIGIRDAPTVTEIEKTRRAVASICTNHRSEGRNALLAEVVTGGSLSTDALAVELQSEAIAPLLGLPTHRINPSHFSIVAPWRIRRRGVETRFVIGDYTDEIDQNLTSKIGLAMRWFVVVKAGTSIKAIAKREGFSSDRVVQMLRLAWLEPGIIEAAVSGRQPERLTVDAIFKSQHIALWSEQRSWADRL